MKSEFKAKLVNHLLNKKNAEKGFTLIELLVVIIIIGILAAIALPSFLNQANKARQSEAKTYTGSINRAQQAYFLEKRQFGPAVSNLGLGIKPTTDNYVYSISTNIVGTGAAGTGIPATVTAPGAADTWVNAYGSPIKPALKGYSGVTWIGTTGAGTGEATTLTALFETTNADPTANQSTVVRGIGSAPGAVNTIAVPTSMDSIQ